MTLRAVALLVIALASASLQGCFPVASPGKGAGVMSAHDRRTRDAYLDDQQIETQAADLIYGQIKVLMHVNLTSFNHTVLISGEVPDESIKAEIEKLVSGIAKVHLVNNELAVSPTSSLPSRSNDGLITSKVKLQFVNYGNFNSDHVKVITENGSVYLMGLVKHAEAADAADIASTTQGVQRVIKMFEYLD